MKLSIAQRYAEEIIGKLAPYTNAIALAGSVRRGRPECNDIDLVVIPQRTVIRDLFGKEIGAELPLLSYLSEYVRSSQGTGGWVAGEGNQAGSNFILQLRDTQLDIFVAEPATWGTVLLCRTGSKEHNIWFAGLVKARGGHWNPRKSLRIAGRECDVSTEEAIYHAAGMPYIAPEDRESDKLPRLVFVERV
jgi:DNA polymerase/3'-5' exonuclease PolX